MLEPKITKASKMSYWWKESVIYELFVDKFIGDFKGLTEKLDYFSYLGVNTLWLLPFYPSPMVDDGYDVADHSAVRSQLGTMEDFLIFINKAHQQKIKVLIDFVLNHTSDKHSWFIEARSTKNNPKRNWYIWSDDDNKYSQAYVNFSEIKDTNWIRNELTGDFYYATFYPQQPDLNWDNAEVYNAMLDIAKFWLSRGVDGFRLDAVSRLVKRDDTNCFALPETHKVLKRLRSDLSKEYPRVVFLAESGGWINEAKTFFGNQDECQLVLNFPLASNLLSAISNKDITGVEKVVKESMDGVGGESSWGFFLTNHDSVDFFFLNDHQKKILSQDGKLIDKFGKKGWTGFAARLSEICMGDKDKILWAYKQLFNLPGVPLIYYGNEIGMPNLKFSKPPDDPREYVRGYFDWEEAERQKNDPYSVLNEVRKIILSRRTTLI